MPPKVTIIAPVMSDQERLQKWEEIHQVICQIWNKIEYNHKLCIIRNYSTDKEGQQKTDTKGKSEKCTQKKA
jgi:hypothetical protein